MKEVFLKLSQLRPHLQLLVEKARQHPRWTAGIGVALLLLLTLILRGGDSGPAQEFRTVARGGFMVSVVEGGTLEALNQVVVRNEVDGESRIIYIVPEGTNVKKGDLLVELDSAEAENEFNQQQITYEKALADHVSAENAYSIMQSTVDSEVRTAELAVVFAEMDLRQFEELERDQDLRNAEIEVTTAEAALKLAEERLTWTRKLAEKGFETKSKLDQDELTLMEDSLGLEKARTSKQMTESYEVEKKYATYRSDLDEAKAALERTKKEGESKLAQALADLNSADKTLALNKDTLDRLREQLTATKIYAPQDGMAVYAVSESRWSNESLIEEGASVRKRQELIKLPDTSVMKVDIKIHESHVAQVQVGQTAYVVLDSLPDQRFRGEVTKVAVLPDTQSRWGNPNLKVYSTEVVIRDPLPDVKPGVSARAEVIISQLQNVVAVPIQAVTTLKGKQVCYVKKVRGVEPVPVEVGLFNTKLIEIKSGLKEGDRVLLAPPLDMQTSVDGSVVEPGESVEAAEVPLVSRQPGGSEAAAGAEGGRPRGGRPEGGPPQGANPGAGGERPGGGGPGAEGQRPGRGGRPEGSGGEGARRPGGPPRGGAEAGGAPAAAAGAEGATPAPAAPEAQAPAAPAPAPAAAGGA